MTCSNCRTNNDENAKFCDECGDALLENNYHTKQTYIKNPTIGKFKILIGAVLAILGFFVVVVQGTKIQVLVLLEY